MTDINVILIAKIMEHYGRGQDKGVFTYKTVY